MARKRIGLLGGSFNPVHNAHLRLAVEAVEQAGLDRLDLVPAAKPPHKGDRELLPFRERCRHLELVLRDRPGLDLNPLEGERQGPSYTVDTLRQYHSKQPGDEIFFVLGGDEFLNLDSWHRSERIPELAHLLLASRGEKSHRAIADFIARRFDGAQAEGPGDLPWSWILPRGGSIRILELPRLDISSSMIRERLRRGLSIAWLVPEQIEAELRDISF